MKGKDVWNAGQYDKFRNERSQPFFDLVDLVEPKQDMAVVDLGCGTGALTALLHERFGAAQTLGIDSSPNMLARAPTAERLRFEIGDIADVRSVDAFDLVFSNAAFQWVSGHEILLAKIMTALRSGGQVAIQIPKNNTHPTQSIGRQLETEPPFDAIPPNPVDGNVLEPEAYAQILDRLGFTRITVRLQIYLHRLDSREAVFEWVRGTYLNWYAESLSTDLYQEFLAEYRRRLSAALPDDHPFLFTFRRILMHAVKP